MLLNSCKNFSLAVNIGRTKYVELGRHVGMMTNKHFIEGSNSYKKVKTIE